MATKSKSKKIVRGRKVTQKNKIKLSQLNWPAILIAAAVLIGLFSSGRELFVSPSEAARGSLFATPRTTTTRSDAPKDATGRDYNKEATDLFYNGYSHGCFLKTDPAERCACTAGVLAKLKALLADVIATGDTNYRNLISRLNFYIKHIQETMAAWKCGVDGHLLQPQTATPSVSRWLQFFRIR
jgi:hypothetical protein